MIIQIIPKLGGPPLQLEAAQFVVFNDEGTPIAVAGEFGPRGAVRIAHAGEDSFQATLRAFGYGQHEVQVSRLDAPAPPNGAKQLII